MSFLDHIFRPKKSVRNPSVDTSNATILGDYRAILNRLQELLGDHGYLEQQKIVEGALVTLGSDDEVFWGVVQGCGFWGGVGSVSDVEFGSTAPIGNRAAYQHQREKEALFARLAKRLVADGMHNPRIESLGEMYAESARKSGYRL